MPVFMKPGQRQHIQNRIKGLEAMLRGQEAPGADFVYTPFQRLDKKEIRREIMRWRGELAKGTPPELDRETRDVLARRAKSLERLIVKEMPTRDEMMGQKARNVNTGAMTARVETERAVQKQMKWQLSQGKNVSEWQQIMRTLEPENPSAGNVERLRRGHSTAN